MNCHLLRALALAAVCTASALSGIGGIGCTASATLGPAPYVATTGRLVLDWTIDGKTDPSVCTQSAASHIGVQVLYADGSLQGEYVADCTAFATTIDLPEGHYSGTAELRDANGAPRTTTIDINSFEIVRDNDLRIPIDFPSNSFK
jgi:hypothetical protein